MKLACIQSSYIPWKGYFDIIHDVDVFVFLDDVQMTKRDWRSRNKIKTPKGTEWLTVPFKGGRDQQIHEVQIVEGDWQKRHQKALEFNYSNTPYYQEYEWLLNWLYEQPHENLSALNRRATGMICDALGIQAEFICSVDLNPTGTKDDRLLDICTQVGAQTYLSGPSARAYIHEKKFQDAGIELKFKSYDGYPEYPQKYPPFEHYVTILDVLFNCGPDAPHYIWGWRSTKS